MVLPSDSFMDDMRMIWGCELNDMVVSFRAWNMGMKWDVRCWKMMDLYTEKIMSQSNRMAHFKMKCQSFSGSCATIMTSSDPKKVENVWTYIYIYIYIYIYTYHYMLLLLLLSSLLLLLKQDAAVTWCSCHKFGLLNVSILLNIYKTLLKHS